ncbi:XVIPCD domain-containing protein [Luteibacter sp.]|uniref:XVIPCD domain-containing protein n=1 Tax=Luteibacter sp. TaxID=1886636 RepID=UPI003F80F077
MPLNAKAEAVLQAFGKEPGVTPDQLKNLTDTINASPALVDEVNRAVDAGHLQRIVALNNPHAGGEYNAGAHEMRLPLTSLSTPAGGKYDASEATFVLGHELQHGFNAADIAKANTQFTHDLQAVAQSKTTPHDYTKPVGDVIAASRRDEAGAEISGWNATVSAARLEAQKNHAPAPTLEDIYKRNPGRMDDFIHVDRSQLPATYSMRSNLTVNADLSMPSTPANIEGMGKNYFDRSSTLGHNGNSSYANYYGAWATGVAVQYERHYGNGQAPMALDLKGLHLNPDVMAQNGIDLGANKNAMPYLDTSTQPPTQRNFRDSATSHVYQPVTPGPAPVTLDHADHPDHALFRQTQGAVHRLDAQHGRAPDRQSDNLAGALTVAAREQGLKSVDHVVLNADASTAYAVEGALDSPHKRIAEASTQQAVNTPIEQSSAAWQAAAERAQQASHQHTAQQQAASQQQAVQQQPAAPQPQAMSHSLPGP